MSTMENFKPSKLIENRLGEFSCEVPSAEEVDQFYSLAKVQLPENRPYTWSNTIFSLDGVVTVGHGKDGVRTVGLKNLPNSQAKTDFYLLNAGWAYADAILMSSGTLVTEHDQKCHITYKKLIQYRREVLGKSSDQPDLVVVTASGKFDLNHVIWATDRRKFVATSKRGYENIIHNLQSTEGSSMAGLLESEIISQLRSKYNIVIRSFSSESDEKSMDVQCLALAMKKDWGFNYVDLSAGPSLISYFMKDKCIDEFRYTSSGIVVGKHSIGESDTRVEMFPGLLNEYPAQKWPILEFVGLRMWGPFHVYHRGKWIFRH